MFCLFLSGHFIQDLLYTAEDIVIANKYLSDSGVLVCFDPDLVPYFRGD